MSEKKVIASISGGKDSLAALVTHIESGGRCDGAIYCRIMFDEKISAEYPEHEEWLHEKCFPTLEREYGVRTRIVQSEETYIEHFYRKFKRGKKVGQIYGFPSLWCPWCNSDLKVGPLERFKKTYGEYIAITGIAADETKRINRKNGAGKIRPLVEKGVTEAGAAELCRKRGLYSPAYKGRERLGCWFCHNQRLGEMKRIYYDYPDLWKKLEKLQKDSAIRFTPRFSVTELAERFSFEGQQIRLFEEGL